MTRHHKSEGLVLTKKTILKNDRLIIIFTRDLGKQVFSARGVSSITSRRLPHLETGNFIQFSYTTHNNFNSIGEAEMIYGYSKIKNDAHKLDNMYAVLFVLNKILPEGVEEKHVFEKTLEILKSLNNKDVSHKELEKYFCEILTMLGYLGEEQTNTSTFDVFQYLNNQFNIKILK